MGRRVREHRRVAVALFIKGANKAVIGGWDPSARKFFKTDEHSFTVPFGMFKDMLNRHGESFLTTKTWAMVQKKIARSKKAWGENL